MKPTGQKFITSLALLCLVLSSMQIASGQYAMPSVMDSASLQSQLDYIQERTRIYNDFRAIRDDIFMKMKRNALDSLRSEKLEVSRLNSELAERNLQIETLNSELAQAKSDRDQAIRTKDSFFFLGIEMQKGLYNTIMWFIVVGLAVVGVIFFLMFKHSYVVTVQTKKELEATQAEYEEYKKSAREKYEKLVVNHHNEIMKLKRS
jgi:ABC-type multidrug transport system fused ATPase/permease subunit